MKSNQQNLNKRHLEVIRIEQIYVGYECTLKLFENTLGYLVYILSKL